ncbi:hypothetical protein C8R43DRAFT_341010 [Mycena crocata]|nr:hypothetical protein C8R43DRAFT_341010 [Mycena crocata]
MRLFAQELVEQVIDCCTDPNAMKAWGLVCKRWLHRTRYHLFSKVSLSKENLPFFVDLVEASPLPILSFIHELTLCYNGSPPDAALLERLYACSNLESIWIETPLSVEDSQLVLDWLNSEESLRRHMRAWGNSSSISSLNLDVQGVAWIPLQTIVDIISCVPTIDGLVMCLHNEAGIDSDAVEPSAFPLALKSLTLVGDGTDPFLSWLLSLSVSPRLDHLILDGIPADFNSLATYFQRAGHELKILRVVFLSTAAGQSHFFFALLDTSLL